MNFISKLIKNIREEYKEKEAQMSTIELLYITKAIKKASVGKC